MTGGKGGGNRPPAPGGGPGPGARDEAGRRAAGPGGAARTTVGPADAPRHSRARGRGGIGAGRSSPPRPPRVDGRRGRCRERAMPRRVYLLGVGVALVGLALALTDRALDGGRRATYRQLAGVQGGMTAEEVRALFGRPPDRRRFDPGFDVTLEWAGVGGKASVDFRSGRVRWAQWDEEPTPNPFARLRAWLGW